MGLATLLNLPTTQELIAQFSFANQDSHRKINAAIRASAKFGQVLPEYPLDPIPLFQNGLIVWSLNHQNAHNNQNQVLGIAGQDLTVNFAESEEQLFAFIQDHFIEHYQAETMLGVR